MKSKTPIHLSRRTYVEGRNLVEFWRSCLVLWQEDVIVFLLLFAHNSPSYYSFCLRERRREKESISNFSTFSTLSCSLFCSFFFCGPWRLQFGWDWKIFLLFKILIKKSNQDSKIKRTETQFGCLIGLPCGNAFLVIFDVPYFFLLYSN